MTEGLGLLAKIIARKHLGCTAKDETADFTCSIGLEQSQLAATEDLQSTPSAMENSRA